MRKFFLCMMLVVALFSAGIAAAADSGTATNSTARSVLANPFIGFGFYPSYVTSGSVKVFVERLPDYSKVDTLTPSSVRFGGIVRDNYTYSGKLPVGTLTILSGDASKNGTSYRLTPYQYYGSYNTDTYNAGDFVDYYSNYESDSKVSELTGRKLLWNLYTSPDVIEGASLVKETKDYKNISVGKNDIVPFVKLISDGDTFGRIGRVDLYFVKSGDWETPVAVNYPNVTLSASGYSTTFTDFNKSSPVRKSLENIYLSETSGNTITVSYSDGKGEYSWNFYVSGRGSSIDWQDLSLRKQPLTLKSGDIKRIGINLPSSYKLPVDFTSEDVRKKLVTVMNESVVEVQDVSLTYEDGVGTWSGDKWKEEKSTLLAFTLLAGEEGVTTLKVSLPQIGTYYRGITVTDDRGDVSATGKPGTLSPAFVHRTTASYLEGRPYYPSASDENNGITFNTLTGMTPPEKSKEVYYDINGDKHERYDGPEGYIGIVDGHDYGIHRLIIDAKSGDKFSITDYGVSYNSYNESGHEYASMPSFKYDGDFNEAKIWLEFPERPELNVALTSLDMFMSFDKIRSTKKQLEDFAPYFELKHASQDVDTLTSLNWSFVNPKTMQKVTPSGITELTVVGKSVSGNEGTIDLNTSDDVRYRWYTITFSYKYEGVTYEWDFYDMSSYYANNTIPSNISVNATENAYAYNYNNSDWSVVSAEIFIWDEDVVSASKMKFTSSDFASSDYYYDSNARISFDLKGLKVGQTHISLIYKNSDGDYRRAISMTINVVSSSIAPVTSSDLVAEFVPYTQRYDIVEGKPNNMPDGVYFSYGRNLRLTRKDKMTSYSDYYRYESRLYGTLYVSSDVEGPSNSWTLYPQTEYDYDSEMVTVYYNVGSYPDGTVISWDFPNDINKKGSYTVKAPDFSEAEKIRPYVKLNKDGLNVSSVEWYFIDSTDKKIDTPETVTNVSVDVRYTDYNGNTSYIYDYSMSGNVAVALPALYVSRVNFAFRMGGTVYEWYFNVAEPSNYSDSTSLFTWEAGNNPLVMSAGDSRDVIVTVSFDNRATGNFKPFVGNTDVLSVDLISSADNTATLRLSAKTAGMTTLSLMYSRKYTYPESEWVYDEETGESHEVIHTRTYYDGSYLTWPREVWVSSRNSTTGKNEVPHLTDDLDALTKNFTANSNDVSGWEDYETTQDSTTPGGNPSTPVATYDESPKNSGVNGLSIQPRFAMPKDPSADALQAVWDFLDTMGMPYGVEKFSEGAISVLASRDAVTVFNELKTTLISEKTPKLAAIVLPEIYVYSTGMYMFRVPADNITGTNRAIFFAPVRSKDVDAYPYRYTEEEWNKLNQHVFVDDSGNLSNAISGENYINAAVYLLSGKYAPVITAEATSRDVYLITGKWPEIEIPNDNNTSEDNKPGGNTSDDNKPDDNNSGNNTNNSGNNTNNSGNNTNNSGNNNNTNNNNNNNSNNGTDSGNNSNNSGQTSERYAPRVSPESVSTQVLRNLAHNDATVRALPTSSLGYSRTGSSLSQEQRNAITSENREIASVLPEITVEATAVYIFGVSLDLEPGTQIFLDMTRTSTVTSPMAVSASEEYEADYTFLDDDGNTITDNKVPSNGHVNVAAYLESGYTYSPVITTSKTSTGVSSSSGGCNAGLSAAILLVGLALIRRKK